MTLPKKKRRKIVVNAVTYYWTTARPKERRWGEAWKLTLPLRIEQADAPQHKIRAFFNGTAIDFLFSGRTQSLSVRPRVVRQIIEEAIGRGWPSRHQPCMSFEHAEELFPAAVEPMDVADQELRAACEQWFVPYPGKP